jgi:hypothetical protein
MLANWLSPGTLYEKLEYRPCTKAVGTTPIAWTQMSAFVDMRKRAASERAREGQHLVIGSWQHSLVFQQKLGEKDYGPPASNAGLGTNEPRLLTALLRSSQNDSARSEHPRPRKGLRPRLKASLYGSLFPLSA